MLKKILIIDDSIVARMGVKKYIPKEGYEIYEAKDGQEGLNIFKEINPDITFLDLTMPVMDGLTLLGYFNDSEHDSKIIVISADIQQKTRQKVLALGAIDILKKPPQKDEVLNILESTLKAI